MFGIDSSELFVIGMVALLVIGPQRLPQAMRIVGQWVAKGRAMTRHVRSGFDTMVREAELEEMQKAWAKQNEAIMKATAMDPTAFMDPMMPLEATAATTALPAPEAALANLTVPLAESASEPASKQAADHAADAATGATTSPAPMPEKPKSKRSPRTAKPAAKSATAPDER